MRSHRRVAKLFFSAFFLLCTLPILAQKPEQRLGKSLTDTNRTMLAGSRNPQARMAQDTGAVSPDMAVPGITLVFKRSASQEAALQTLLTAVQDPHSPQYHHWLTPESFAARFGVADEDIATAKSWLESHGFHVENVARNRDRITFSGTAAQVQAAFGTELHHYRTDDGQMHFAPATDISLPASLASVTAAVLHLSDFRPKPNWKVPDFTAGSTQAHYLTPQDILTMYDGNALYSNGLSGSLQSIAIAGQSYVNPSNNLERFQFLTGEHYIGRFIPVLVPGSGVEAVLSGDEGESEIDMEYSSGIAQGLQIFLVFVGTNTNYDVYDAMAFAITENIAPVVNVSYSTCETLMSPNDMDQANSLFEEAAAQGQTVVVSSGDAGSTACEPYSSSTRLTTAQKQALTVNFPASSPYVTAVGGTQMASGTYAEGSSSYWSSATGGIDDSNSLLSYAPEVVWNEGSAKFGFAAGGGGTSAYYPRPAWQSAFPGMPSGAYRLLPDISLQSSINSPGFLVCSDDYAMLASEGQTSSCTNEFAGSNGQYTVAGGTSFAAPMFAGFVALLNASQHATGQGNLNPVLYSLATNPDTYAAAFHDITSGSNACVASATNCVAADESSYMATSGYDEATGLGSTDFNALLSAWPSSPSTSLEYTNIAFLLPGGEGLPGQAIPLQIEVWGTSSLPTGNVSIAVDGVVVATVPISPFISYEYYATADYNLTAPMTVGSHVVTAMYQGDATHASSVTTNAVMVGNVTASGSVQLSAANLTVTNGSSASTQITVTPSGGYDGRLVWSLSVTSGTSQLSACYAITPLTVNNASTTKLTIGVGTACNSALPNARGNFVPLSQHVAQSRWPSPPMAITYAGLLLCGWLARRRRNLSIWMLLCLLLPAAGANLIGCGSSSGGGSKTTTPPPNPTTTYTLTLTGTDSVNTVITASTTFTLTVN